MALRCWHEREAAVRDVPEDSSVTSRLAGARKGRESFAVDVRHNVPLCVVGGTLLGLLGGQSARSAIIVVLQKENNKP